MTENNKEIEDIETSIDEIDEITEISTSETEYPKPFDNPLPENYLGHIVAYDTGLKIGRSENVVYAVIQPDERDRIEVGDYVRVPYYRPDEIQDGGVDVKRQLLASVKDLIYNTSLDDREFTSTDSFGAEQYRFMAELSPISEISLDEENTDFVADFVSKPPRPTVRIDEVAENGFLRCGLDVPNEGIYVGDVSVNGVRVPNPKDPLEYYLFNPNATDDTSKLGEPTIFRHVLVAGSTGTGKTHASKNILRQFAQCKEYNIDIPADEKGDDNTNERTRGLNITVIDPEDEYTELGQDPNEENYDRAKSLAKDRKGLQYGAIGDGDTEFEIFAPNTKNSTTKQLDTGSNEVTDFGIPFRIVKHHKKLMMPDDPEGPTKQLISKILNDFFSQQNQNCTYNQFRDWFDSTKMDLLLKGDKYNDSIVNAAARRLTDRDEYRAVFDVGSNHLTDDKLINRIFRPNKTSVITTGHLRGPTQNLVIQAISSYIVESKISSNPTSTTIKGTPMILALDEAHEYIQNPETTREYFIVSKFRRAARRGRKDKFGLYFITQNPADIDGEIRNQINTKIYLQLDRKVVDESDVYVPPDYTKSLPEFDKGQMVVDQPNVNPVEVVGLDTCLVKHSK